MCVCWFGSSTCYCFVSGLLSYWEDLYLITPKGSIYSGHNGAREQQKHIVCWEKAMPMSCYDHVGFEDGHHDGFHWVSAVISEGESPSQSM